MGTVSVLHFSILAIILSILALPAFLPLFIKPSGKNQYGPSARPEDFVSSFSVCMRKYVDVSGRARRSEYWWFYLATTLISVVLAVVDSAVGDTGIVNLLGFAFFLPSLAAGVRRLHDINRTGWWLLLMFSGLGVIGLIVLLAWPSTPDEPDDVF